MTNKTIEEQVEEIIKSEDLGWAPTGDTIRRVLTQSLQERDRIAYERGVEDTKIKNKETIEYYQLRAKEECVELLVLNGMPECGARLQALNNPK